MPFSVDRCLLCLLLSPEEYGFPQFTVSYLSMLFLSLFVSILSGSYSSCAENLSWQTPAKLPVSIRLASYLLFHAGCANCSWNCFLRYCSFNAFYFIVCHETSWMLLLLRWESFLTNSGSIASHNSSSQLHAFPRWLRQLLRRLFCGIVYFNAFFSTELRETSWISILLCREAFLTHSG